MVVLSTCSKYQIRNALVVAVDASLSISKDSARDLTSPILNSDIEPRI